MNDKKKMIGLFNDSFPPIMDGVAVATWNYAYWLNNSNVPVSVITAKVPDSPEEPFPVIRYSSIPILFRKPYRFGTPHTDLNFQKKLEKIPFELVHAHCPFVSGNLALKIAKERNIPFIATFHSKYRDDFERAFHSRKVAELATKEMIKFFDKADEVWIPQADVEDTIREYGYKGKLIVMENGNDFSGTEDIVSFRANARQELGFDQTDNVLLFVGQHIWEKNTGLIIDALSKINGIPFKMVFIGKGYAAKGMEQKISEYGLSKNTHFKGIITDRLLLKKYYAAADLFLFPSLYDNAPLVVREAAAMHTPSILAKDSTSSKIITDNFNGFITENNSDFLALKISELLSNKDRIRVAGINAGNTINRKWSDIAEEVYDRYKFWMKKKN